LLISYQLEKIFSSFKKHNSAEFGICFIYILYLSI